jgi:hypothetical protein
VRWESLRVAVGLSLAAVGAVALAVTAVHGGQTVQDLRGPTPVAHAELDDAYYRCIDIQAHSVVSDRRPVLFEGPDFGAYIALLKAVGSWVTIAGHRSPSDVALSLEDKRGRGTCLGQVVVARERGADGRMTTLVGSGASVPGKGPPPAEPALEKLRP